jgi:outer membrane protein OmpA-like peptidoglycan-associated protein
MKKTALATAALILLTCTAIAQQLKPKKPTILSFNISFSDYTTPGIIRDSSINKALDGTDWLNPGKKSFGLGISWLKPLTSKIDFSANLNGTFSNFPKLFVKGDSIGQAGFTPQLDALFHLNALKATAGVNPFLTLGAGAAMFQKEFAAYAPLGVGLKIRFKEGAFLIAQTQYRLALTDAISNDYLFYSIGFAQTTGKRKKEDPVTVPPPAIPVDKDGDGITDDKDACPTEKGTVNGCPDADGDGVADKDDQCPALKGSINGCPDTDGDGVADKDDKCPDIKGSLIGCPDSDGDGQADKDDKCPDVKGLFNGCPDSDGDGVGDGDDKCPTVAGKAGENGCPEIKQEVIEKVNFAAKNIYFRFASDELLNRSLPPLKEVVQLLKKDPSLQLMIEAHTDNIGTEERNLALSERRAERVATFFKNSGINPARISIKGYGETRPVADNSTDKGRSKNRRVEMKLSY